MKGFFEMTKELQDLAGQHDSIAESLSKLVLKDLQTTIQEVKQERKRVYQKQCYSLVWSLTTYCDLCV